MLALNTTQQRTLLQLARLSIEQGLSSCRPLFPAMQEDPLLNFPAACFVTLSTQQRQLRGCIGSLQPYRPLVQDVCANAYAAAFCDRRFRPVNSDELAGTHIEISVLGPLEKMQFSSEQDLLNQLQVPEDGVLLEEGERRATFLPLVWIKLADKQQFLAQLKAKAGLPTDYWSDTLRCYRFKTQVFKE